MGDVFCGVFVMVELLVELFCEMDVVLVDMELRMLVVDEVVDELIFIELRVDVRFCFDVFC